MSYDLHVNVFNIKCADYFFITSTFFRHSSTHCPPHCCSSPASSGQFSALLIGLQFTPRKSEIWVTRHASEIHLGSRVTSWTIFSRSFWAKPTQLEIIKVTPKLEWIFNLLHLDSTWYLAKICFYLWGITRHWISLSHFISFLNFILSICFDMNIIFM